MKIIALPTENLYDYLLHVFEGHSRRGLPPDELAIAAHLYNHIVNARDLSVEEHLGKGEITEAGPNGVVVEFAPVEEQ